MPINLWPLEMTVNMKLRIEDDRDACEYCPSTWRFVSAALRAPKMSKFSCGVAMSAEPEHMEVKYNVPQNVCESIKWHNPSVHVAISRTLHCPHVMAVTGYTMQYTTQRKRASLHVRRQQTLSHRERLMQFFGRRKPVDLTIGDMPPQNRRMINLLTLGESPESERNSLKEPPTPLSPYSESTTSPCSFMTAASDFHGSLENVQREVLRNAHRPQTASTTNAVSTPTRSIFGAAFKASFDNIMRWHQDRSTKSPSVGSLPRAFDKTQNIISKVSVNSGRSSAAVPQTPVVPVTAMPTAATQENIERAVSKIDAVLNRVKSMQQLRKYPSAVDTALARLDRATDEIASMSQQAENPYGSLPYQRKTKDRSWISAPFRKSRSVAQHTQKQVRYSFLSSRYNLSYNVQGGTAGTAAASHRSTAGDHGAAEACHRSCNVGIDTQLVKSAGLHELSVSLSTILLQPSQVWHPISDQAQLVTATEVKVHAPYS